MILTAVVLITALVLLVLDKAPSDMLFGGALIVLLLGGIISPTEALAGFSNKGMATVGLLFIVSQAVNRTGVFRHIARSFLTPATNLTPKPTTSRHPSRSGPRIAMVRIMFPVTVLSAFLNNTPIVQIFAPEVRRWAVSRGFSPAKFLIPLSYAAIFGGTLTLIGTSTNLVVHGLILQSGGTGFGFFELARVGIPVAVTGYLYLTVVGQRLLPAREDTLTGIERSPRSYFFEMTVPENSCLLGQTIEQAHLRNLNGVYLTDIERDGTHLGPVTPDRRLASGDRLYFAGQTRGVADLLQRDGLQVVDDETFNRDTAALQEKLVEVVIAPQCPLIGKSIRDAEFRSFYDASVVAASRNGERVATRLGDMVIHAGDTLVLLARSNAADTLRGLPDFLLVDSVAPPKVASPRKQLFAGMVVLAMIAGAALGDMLPPLGDNPIDMFIAAGAAALLLLAGRTISVNQARSAIRWDVLITIGAAFGVSQALINSGLASWISSGIISAAAPAGVVGALVAVYIGTSFFTEIITNNAAAALMFPIALATASQAGAPPLPFFVAVAIGASASFATPIGYQTNLIVQGVGNYRFRDFLMVGLPLNLITAIIATLSIVFWYGI